MEPYGERGDTSTHPLGNGKRVGDVLALLDLEGWDLLSARLRRGSTHSDLVVARLLGELTADAGEGELLLHDLVLEAEDAGVSESGRQLD